MRVAGSLESWQNRRRESDGSESGPYRFFFFSSDRGEPPHVHVTRDRKTAKFWLHSVNLGFAPNGLNKVSALVQKHQAELWKAWHDDFKSGNRSRGGQARRVTEHALVVELRDGRSVSVPINWYPRLAEGRPSADTN
jgi:hypothetical protein